MLQKGAGSSDLSPTCFSAVNEVDSKGRTQCWIGPSILTEPPSPTSRRGPGLNATCYTKGVEGIEPVTVREEKFITLDEVVSVTFAASRPVTLQVNGGSYTTGTDNRPNEGVVGGLQSNATCLHDQATEPRHASC